MFAEGSRLLGSYVTKCRSRKKTPLSQGRAQESHGTRNWTRPARLGCVPNLDGVLLAPRDQVPAVRSKRHALAEAVDAHAERGDQRMRLLPAQAPGVPSPQLDEIVGARRSEAPAVRAE